MALDVEDTLLNGHYRIVRQLGRGGFGFVYLAQDTLLGEQVAIKELIPALVGDETMLKRFLAEAKATMRLSHDRIVRTHNIFSEGGNYYIVMEYMPGGSLEERLREHSPLPVDEAVRIAAEICEGLSYAHHRGVVHCDLKPANILFAADGSAKVADFGIAHVSEEMLTRTWQTPAGFVAGTLPYMSPEQADGVRNDPRIDIYAVGAMLYRMLTGKTYLEFDSRETPGATADNVLRIRNEVPVPPGAHNPAVPAWLHGVVLRALTKQAKERYPSADEMQAALVRWQAPLAPAPTQARRTPPGPGARPGPAARRRTPLPTWFWPAAAGVAALLVVLVIVIGADLGGGGGAETAVPQPTRTDVAAATSVPVLSPTQKPPPAFTPKETDRPRPIATATEISGPTAMEAATASSTPTSTRLPTASPTATVTPEPATNTPKPTRRPTPVTPTRTPLPSYAVPVLLSPQEWEAIGDRDADITFEWASVGPLSPDVYYLIEIGSSPVPFLTKETQYQCMKYTKDIQWACVPSSDVWLPHGAQYGYRSQWQVTVVLVHDGAVVRSLSPTSETRNFVWRIP